MIDLALILGAMLPAAAGGEALLNSILAAALHQRVPKVAISALPSQSPR